MRTFSKTLLVVALSCAASPVFAAQKAHAQPAAAPATAAGATGDVRCLLTMGALASNKANQQPATLGVYFFEGRISARAPGIDLASALKAEAARMGAADLQAEAKRCTAIFNQAVQALQQAQANFARPVPVPPAGAAPATPAPAPAPATPTPTPK